jgi:hypothetical protein
MSCRSKQDAFNDERAVTVVTIAAVRFNCENGNGADLGKLIVSTEGRVSVLGSVTVGCKGMQWEINLQSLSDISTARKSGSSATKILE